MKKRRVIIVIPPDRRRNGHEGFMKRFSSCSPSIWRTGTAVTLGRRDYEEVWIRPSDRRTRASARTRSSRISNGSIT